MTSIRTSRRAEYREKQLMYEKLFKSPHPSQTKLGTAPSITKGPCGSVYTSSMAGEIPDWRITDEKSTFDRFIKRMGMTAYDKEGKAIGAWTMATRGTAKSVGDVAMTLPVYTDANGEKFTILQEEARPIDLVRNGKDSRVLAFPAGIIGDEAKFSSESALECAKREFIEETGMQAKNFENLSEPVRTTKNLKPIMSSPGLTDEATHFFYAEVENLRPVSKAVTDGGITRGWWKVPIKNLQQWVNEMEALGKPLTSQTSTALLKAIMRGKLHI